MQTAEAPNNDSEDLKMEKTEDTKFALFQSVISKYFEIIKSIMPKLTSLSLQNEEFQKTIFTLENKMAKIEKDQQNLHYEVRSNHITIDTKMNNILAEYSNIMNENAKIKKQTEELNRQIKLHQSGGNSMFGAVNVVPLPTSQVDEKNAQSPQKSQVLEQKQQKEANEKPNFMKNKAKKITFNEQATKRASKQGRLRKRNAKIITSRSKNSLSIDEDQSLSDKDIRNDSSSKNEVFNSDKLMELTERHLARSMKSEKIMLRKGTLKSTTKSIAPASKAHLSKSHKVIIDNQREDYLQSFKFSEILKEIESFHRNNEQIKKNYEQLMGDYCKINQDQFNSIDVQLKEIRIKLSQIDYVHVHMQKIKLGLESKIGNLVRDLQFKIDGKVDRSEFREFLVEINQRIAAIHQERKKVANKEQTKKAIQFLENKLNFICDSFEESQRPPKLHLVDLEANTFRRTSQMNQRSSTSKEGRSSKLNPARPSHTFVSTHQHRPSNNGLDTAETTKRQAESVHSRFKNERRFNQDLNEFRMYSLDKTTTDETKTIRKKSPPKESVNASLLKEKSMQMLGKDKPKPRNKLKKEPLIFQYDN